MRKYKHKTMDIILGNDNNYYFLSGSFVDYETWKRCDGYLMLWDNIAYKVRLENMPQSAKSANELFRAYIVGVSDGSISTYRLD